MAGQPDLLVDMLKSDWGITLANDMVIDPAVNPPLGAATLPTQPHPITQSIQNVDVLFPTARSITVAQQPSGVTITDLGSTGASAWGDNNYSTSNPQLVYDANVDTPGPLQIAVAGENSATGGRVVVFGDSEFADDTNFNQYGNRDMFINSVDWAAGQEKLISLTPYSAEQRTFQPPSPLATVGLIVLAVCVVPLLILVAGVWTWMARRRRG
jgi:ABC-type uncharacterized transport system involved in gliding motility auxiliary subunit